MPTGREVAPPARQVLARDHRPAEVLGTRQEAAGWPSSAWPETCVSGVAATPASASRYGADVNTPPASTSATSSQVAKLTEMDWGYLSRIATAFFSSSGTKVQKVHATSRFDGVLLFFLNLHVWFIATFWLISKLIQCVCARQIRNENCEKSASAEFHHFCRFRSMLLGGRPDLEGERLPGGGCRASGSRAPGEEPASPGPQNSK